MARTVSVIYQYHVRVVSETGLSSLPKVFDHQPLDAIWSSNYRNCGQSGLQRCCWCGDLSGRCERFIGRVLPVGRDRRSTGWRSLEATIPLSQHLLPRYSQNSKPATHTGLRVCRLPSLDQPRRRVGYLCFDGYAATVDASLLARCES